MLRKTLKKLVKRARYHFTEVGVGSDDLRDSMKLGAVVMLTKVDNEHKQRVNKHKNPTFGKIIKNYCSFFKNDSYVYV